MIAKTVRGTTRTEFTAGIRAKIRSVCRLVFFSTLPPALVLGVVLLCGPTCSTLATLTQPHHPGGWIYSGTQENIASIQSTPSSTIPSGPEGIPREAFDRRGFAFLDFPFSLVLDTGLLPLTIALQLIFGDGPR